MKAGSDRLASFGERVDLKLGKLVGLFAKGGSGGRGGAGGDGMNGSRGRSGSDASRFSSGSDGGPGGDGGDGGDGGHGGNGGGGGNILLSTPAEQTHLMMLARLDVKPGDAGIGGIGGAGGRGGSGGPGGSSYSWREKVGEDDNGHSIYRKYSNPGGSRGPSGSPGRDGSAGRSGQQGPKGKYAFGIETQTGLRRQPQHIFDLEVLSYEIVDAFEDGILEFGEQLYIRNLSVRNRGSMPMPASRNAYVYLLHSEWWAAEPIALTVPLELGPGESYTFSEELAVRVREARPDEISAKALQVKAMLRTESIMGGILLPFVHGRKQTPLDLRYPLEIRPVRGHHS
ncbi:MAG: collagen-like protein, partial [Bacteroidota bacterium]